MRRFLCTVVVYASVVLTPLSAFAGWVLYDDFRTGTIDTTLWERIGTSANVSVVNNRLRFVHKQGFPNKSTWLKIKKSPATVKGIRVSVFVQSCTGDVRARTGLYVGKIGNDTYVWNQLAVQESARGIWGDVFLEKRLPGGITQDLDSAFYCRFRNPMDSSIIGKWFTTILTFTPNSAVYNVSGMGISTYKAPASLKAAKSDDTFMGIGTRSANGDGPCTVFFDNVYVLR